MAAVVAAATAWGVVAARWTPRGPLTNAQALWSIGISVAVGLGAGWWSRSRWAMLAAPAAFVVALELTRIGVRGPSVDAPHLSPFGMVALLAGRGVHGVLSVLPLGLGAAYGAGLTRRGHRGSRIRRAGTAVLTTVLVAVTVAVSVPARTAPFPGPGGVAELALVDVGPYRLGMMIRGADVGAPVLLFIPGAPGGTEIGSTRQQLAALEQRFVVVTLDRRGGGSSYPALEPTDTVTLGGAVADTVAVTDYLRDRFHQDKIYLLGHSGGSIISVLAVQRHPGKYHAYIGTGQAVDLAASDRLFYQDILAWAGATGHDSLARRLTDQGAPPYADVYLYEPIMTYAPRVYDYDHGPNAKGATGFGLDVPEYTLLQKIHMMNGVLDTWSALYPDLQHVDLRRDAPLLEVPVYFVQGGHEMRGLATVFDQWYERLRAPRKHLDVFETAGHRAMFEQPDRFVAVMDRVLTGR
ncbi:pimeloyl-ACP methyl ester carboxylesterase [Micromonospora pisi]|uniref:Pimeloyl-ACP methyl ester carboxylesterase n=2 Tax=Micromonospora pisi TaxID=589240 RepID=A0A495JTK0_9ACTN|nr:pimeloyl-ACP methyl ester carboxylesterase [Micromonospora pisi]